MNCTVYTAVGSHNGAGTLSDGRARHQRGLPGHLRETESVILEEGSDQMTILSIKGVYRTRSRSPDKTSQDRFQPKRRKAAATGELSYADPSPQPNHWSGKPLSPGRQAQGCSGQGANLGTGKTSSCPCRAVGRSKRARSVAGTGNGVKASLQRLETTMQRGWGLLQSQICPSTRALGFPTTLSLFWGQIFTHSLLPSSTRILPIPLPSQENASQSK